MMYSRTIVIVEKSDTFSFANSAAKLLFREPIGDCYEIVPLGGEYREQLLPYQPHNTTSRCRVCVAMLLNDF